MDRIIINVILITSALIVSTLSLISWRKRAAAGPAAAYFAISLAAVAIYNFGYALEITQDDLPEIMFWVRFEHWGIHVIAPSWLIFSLYLTGRDQWISPKRLVFLFVIPAIVFVATQTLGNQNWAHHNPRLITDGPFPTFTYDRTLIVYIGLLYDSLCFVISTGLFIHMLIISAPAFRKQAAIFWCSSIIPMIGAVLYNTGQMPYNLDSTPFAVTLSCLLFSLGFFPLKLFDIVPLARDVIFEGMSDGIFVLDNKDRIIDFNHRLQEMLPDVGKLSIGSSVHDTLISFPDFLDLILKNSTGKIEFKVNQPSGTSYYKGTLAPLENSQKRVVGKIVTLHDYTETKSLLAQLETFATRDSLTGIFNRRHFTFLASQEIYRLQRYGGKLALIMLDLDSFKQINDTYGHAAGDTALIDITDLCRRTLRQSDTLCRFGGEEFMILMPETDTQEAAAFAERLRETIKHRDISFENHSFSLTASFGICGVTSFETTSVEELFRCADWAVYQAKNNGRNRVCIYSKVLEPVNP